MDDYYFLDELFFPETMDAQMLAAVLCVSQQTAERLIKRKTIPSKAGIVTREAVKNYLIPREYVNKRLL